MNKAADPIFDAARDAGLGRLAMLNLAGHGIWPATPQSPHSTAAAPFAMLMHSPEEAASTLRASVDKV